jgi:hypothetical protein
MGNPEPIFMTRTRRASRVRIVGKRHLRACFHGEDAALHGMAYGLGDRRPLLRDDVALAFALRVRRRRRTPQLALHVVDIRSDDDSIPDRVEEAVAPPAAATAPRRAAGS